jgi:hypothetical protein
MDIRVHEEIKIEETSFAEGLTVERDDALKFAARTLQNLEYIEEVWKESRAAHDNPPVRLVTHIINSTLGLVVFSMEKKFLNRILTEPYGDLVAGGWPEWTFHLSGSPADSLGVLTSHVRNGVCHARVRFSSDSPDPTGVTVTIEDAKPKKPVDWRASITAEGLLQFCRRFAAHVEQVIG